VDCVDLELKDLTVVILNADVSRDEFSKGIKGGDYGYGMTGRVFDRRTAVGL
jgi:hypothetical protein